MKYLIFGMIALLSMAPPALAQGFGDDYYVTSSVGSHHFAERSPGRRYNEFNPGIGFDIYQKPFYEFGPHTPVRTFISAGYYHNSIAKPSLYATGGLEICHELSDNWAGCSGVQVGAVTGYYYTVTPAAIGYVKLQRDDLYFKTGLIPPVPSNDETLDVPATLLFQFGYRFN